MRACLERAHGQRGGDEHRDDGGEVGLLGEPERLRQELVDPRVVVALDEVRDRDERSDRERRGAPDPGEPTREASADVVDRERRDRPEHPDLQDRRQRQELDRARARNPGQRCEQHRPGVARQRVADRALAEEPARGDEPDLVAALVREPAVPVDREEQRDGREDLEEQHGPQREDDVTGDGVGAARERREHPRRGRHGGARAGHPRSRYQATVRSRPSRSGVRASKPKSSFARDVSSRRRGWPLGIDVSQTDLAREAGDVGDELRELADRDLGAGTEVDRLVAVVALGDQHQALDEIVDVEELAGRRAVAPEHDLAVRVDHLADQVGDHVGVRRVEVVARPVQVRGQQEHGVDAVLRAVGLRADEDRLLRDAVGRVRLLRVPVPEVVLVEGDRGVLGIRADGSGDDELRCGVDARLLEHVRAHHQVRVPVATGVGAVRADAAHLRGEVEDELRLGVVEQPRGLLHRGQVVVAAPRDDDVVAVGPEPLGEPSADEAAAPRDEDAAHFPEMS